MPEKHYATIIRELARVKALLDRDDLTPSERSEQYGAQQALSWVLGQAAAAPSKLPLWNGPPKPSEAIRG